MSDPDRIDRAVSGVAATVGLAEGEAGVREVLRAVQRLEPVSTRGLSRTTGLPVPIVAAVTGELRKLGLIARERPTQLTAAGREVLGPAALTAVPLELVTAGLERLAAEAPRARTELDQSHCTVETKVRRAERLHGAGALEGKRVLLLGDDDLTSLAIHRYAFHGRFASRIRELAIVDVDPNVLSYLRRHLAKAPFQVTYVRHDLRRPLPELLTGRFDTVFTDPPYTPEGAELFLSRAADALVPLVGGNVFLAFGSKPPAVTLRIQASIAAMGFVIRDFSRNFNDYVHAGLLGGTSNLYHLTSTGETRPLVEHLHEGPLYTGDLRPARLYRCAACKAEHAVGREANWATVDVLRAAGCPACGGLRFLPQPRR